MSMVGEDRPRQRNRDLLKFYEAEAPASDPQVTASRVVFHADFLLMNKYPVSL